MPASSLLNDTVTVLKKNGEKVEGVKASVQSKGTFIQGSDILIETGDLIQRQMSNGGEETYKVIDPGFHEGHGGIPAGYQITHCKLGLPEAKSAVQNITYNMSGSNARVNNNSIDNSTNTVSINSEIAGHLNMLRIEIKRLIESTEEKKEALELVSAIEAQFESGSPSKSVISTLVSALPHAGSIASIGSFLLSAIAG